MLDKRLLWTGGAIAVTVIISFLIANVPSEGLEEAVTESVGGIEAYGPQEIERKEDEDPGYAYIIKEHEGRIAVFVPGKSAPDMIFDILVKFLPDYDQIQMKIGVPVKDYKELSRIIEDYIS